MKPNRTFKPTAQVAAEFNVHHDSIKRWVREGRFPRPIYFNGRAYWPEDEVEKFKQSLLECRTPPAPVCRAA